MPPASPSPLLERVTRTPSSRQFLRGSSICSSSVISLAALASKQLGSTRLGRPSLRPSVHRTPSQLLVTSTKTTSRPGSSIIRCEPRRSYLRCPAPLASKRWSPRGHSTFRSAAASPPPAYPRSSSKVLSMFPRKCITRGCAALSSR